MTATKSASLKFDLILPPEKKVEFLHLKSTWATERTPTGTTLLVVKSSKRTDN